MMLPETLRAATGQRVFVQPSVRPGASLPLVQVRIFTAPPAHSISATTSSSTEVQGEPNNNPPNECFSPVEASESAPDERSANDLSGHAHMSTSLPPVGCSRKTLKFVGRARVPSAACTDRAESSAATRRMPRRSSRPCLHVHASRCKLLGSTVLLRQPPQPTMDFSIIIFHNEALRSLRCMFESGKSVLLEGGVC